jgi:non-ribosomal peptide synthetase component E (peptide arylation enzyme)
LVERAAMTALPSLAIGVDPRAKEYAAAGLWGRVTLDAFLKRNVARAPDRLALADTADKASWSGVEPLRLTARQADVAVSALATRFQELGLKPGGVVALQLPNTVEAVLTLLACQRAGLVPVLLPLLWRSREVTSALEPMAPKALITFTRAGDDRPADQLRYAAAALFSVRFVLAFGPEPPDGVMSLDDCLAPATPREPRAVATDRDPGAELAVVTFRATPVGAAPVPRAHNHCISAALATVLEGRVEAGETILTTLMPASLAALATGLGPWLLTGGTLVPHQPFDAAALSAAFAEHRPTRFVAPMPLLADVLAPLGAAAADLRSVIAVAQDARQLGARERFDPRLSIVDVVSLDEWAVVALARRAGEPRPLPAGPARQPSAAATGHALVETSITPTARLALRGPMVPLAPDVPDQPRITGHLARAKDGAIEILGRADAVAYVGGLGVGLGEIEDVLVAAEEVDAARVTSVADPLFGERIEVAVAPRVTAPVSEETLIARLADHVAGAGLGPHKVPSRIVVDHMVRGDPSARLRSSGPRAASR